MEKTLDELIAQRKKDIAKTRKKLEMVMERDKVYRDSSLTIESLASYLGVNRRLLSETLNSEGEEGFKKYVNSWRVKDAIREIVRMRGQKISLEIVRENAGFGTRSAFYENFRQITGISPAEFHKGKINDDEL